MEPALKIEPLGAPPPRRQAPAISSTDLDSAFRYCLDIARNHYENFPVASIAIPKKFRPYIAAVYAFARTADDFADEESFEGNRMARLKEWDMELEKMETETPRDPIFLALRETIRKFSIPLSLFSDLLTAFKMDCVVTRYATFEHVLNYCHYSANPVGRIVLTIMGYPAPKFLEYSDAICTALQLANFWQDVTVDLPKNRVYIPQEDLARFQYLEGDLFNHKYNENFRRLMLFQVERTKELFENGKPLCAKIPGRLGLELRLTWLGGMAILKKILENQGNVFSYRPVLKKRDVFKMIWGALRRKKFIL